MRHRKRNSGMIKSLVNSPVIRRRVAFLVTEFALIQFLDRLTLRLIQRSQMKRRKKFFQEKYLS